MKIFPNLVEAVVLALSRIFHDGEKADRVVQEVLKSNPKWGSRDRRFIADQIYEVVRWYRFLYEVWGNEPNSDRDSFDWYGVLAVLWLKQGKKWPDFSPFDQLDQGDLESKISRLYSFAIENSYPEWLDAYGRAQLEDKWETTAIKLNEEQNVYLRVNSLKATQKEVILALKKEGVEVDVIDDLALKLKTRKNLQHLKSYKEGWFEIQDLGSQMIGRFAAVKPNSLVIDACAGAGGKTLQLAAQMNNSGKILAMDIHAVKLNNLKERSYRAGIHSVNTYLVDDQFKYGDYRQMADDVLIDAPCSGSGVIRRQPDTKWKLTSQGIEEIRKNQQEILASYSQFVKPGGHLVYATCSVFPSENEEQVKNFLASEAGEYFDFIAEQTLLPQEKDTDGFYMAKMARKR